MNANTNGSALIFDWKCPKCGAGANGAHGKGGAEQCRDRIGRNSTGCSGLLCECEHETELNHGETLADPCRHAECHHCGWHGTFPKAPKGLLPWEKTALAAGWIMPENRAADLALHDEIARTKGAKS